MLNKNLETSEFVAGDYSIADMAIYPWIVPHLQQNQKIENFPSLKKWLEKIAARPTVISAYEKAKNISQ